jgi:uncharacterized protein YjaZ
VWGPTTGTVTILGGPQSSVTAVSDSTQSYVQASYGSGPQASLSSNNVTTQLTLVDAYATMQLRASGGVAGTGPQAGYALVYDSVQAVFRPQKITTDPMTSTSFAAIITTDIGP